VLALCLVLIMQIAAFVPASAASFVGEWMGRIEGDFTGDAGAYGNFKHSADLTFVVAKDGSISGEGAGWEVFERGGGYLNGRADNVAFKISGEIVDYDTGEARLRLEEITPSTYPVFNDQGTKVFVIWPFYNWQVFYIELREGARVDNDAFRDAGSGDTGGTDEFVIGDGGSNVECPQLTVTPTMPPASDPRTFADPTDTASFRFEVVWKGTTPTKVHFDVEGGNGSVKPNFVFNPANMQTSPISVLMDVTTENAEEMEYVFYVDAWVIDPDTGEECHAERNIVTLIVGENQALEPPHIRWVGPVEVTTEKTEAGAQNIVVETGNDGSVRSVTGHQGVDNTVSVTTIDVGSNTKINEYNRVSYSKVLEDRAGEAPAWIKNYYQKFKEPGTLERIRDGALEFFVADQATTYSCLFAYVDTSIQELCGGESIVYVSNGEIHLDHKSAAGEAADRLMADTEKEIELSGTNSKPVWDKLFRALAAPNALIIPNGTEIAVNVQESVDSSITSVTVLDGSALVVDLVSEEMRLVNAGEKYTLETSFDGQAASSEDRLESISVYSVPHWWKIQGYELFWDGVRVGYEPAWNELTAIENFRWNIETYPEKTVSAFYDGQSLSSRHSNYELIIDGKNERYERYWNSSQSIADLIDSVKTHNGSDVQGKYRGNFIVIEGNGYELYLDGQRVGHEPTWTYDEAVADLEVNIARYPEMEVVGVYDFQVLNATVVPEFSSLALVPVIALALLFFIKMYGNRVHGKGHPMPDGKGAL
jgi:hypothetical protein